MRGFGLWLAALGLAAIGGCRAPFHPVTEEIRPTSRLIAGLEPCTPNQTEAALNRLAGLDRRLVEAMIRASGGRSWSLNLAGAQQLFGALSDASEGDTYDLLARLDGSADARLDRSNAARKCRVSAESGASIWTIWPFMMTVDQTSAIQAQQGVWIERLGNPGITSRNRMTEWESVHGLEPATAPNLDKSMMLAALDSLALDRRAWIHVGGGPGHRRWKADGEGPELILDVFPGPAKAESVSKSPDVEPGDPGLALPAGLPSDVQNRLDLTLRRDPGFGILFRPENDFRHISMEMRDVGFGLWRSRMRLPFSTPGRPDEGYLWVLRRAPSGFALAAGWVPGQRGERSQNPASS